MSKANWAFILQTLHIQKSKGVNHMCKECHLHQIGNSSNATCLPFIDMQTFGATLNNTWWRHQMETFSALLAICAGNSPVTGEFPTQRPVTRSFDVYFDLHPNERLSKQSRGWWFETLSSPLWRHRNDGLTLIPAWSNYTQYKLFVKSRIHSMGPSKFWMDTWFHYIFTRYVIAYPCRDWR